MRMNSISIAVQPNATHSPTHLTNCVNEIKSRMTPNVLKWNGSKIEVILVGTPSATLKVTDLRLSFNNTLVTPTAQARNLWVIFDSYLTFGTHIRNVCKTYLFHPCNLQFIHAFATARLGLPMKTLNRLQYVQNWGYPIPWFVQMFKKLLIQN